MTTPSSAPGGFDSGATPSLGLGTADLQTQIDGLTQAITTLTGAIQGQASTGGMQTVAAHSQAAEGARITSGSMAGPNGGGASFSGASGGSGGGGLNDQASGGNGASSRAVGALNGVMSYVAGQTPGMVQYNAYGAYMQNTYGVSAQSAQNAALGYYGTLGNLTSTSAQDAMTANAQLMSMSSGATGSSIYGQGLATAQQVQTALPGMSATAAAQFSAGLYNPSTAGAMMSLGLPTPLQAGTGSAASMASFSSALNARLGVSTLAQFKAFQNPYSFQNETLSNAGWSQSMISDYGSMESGVYQAAGSSYAQQHGISAAQVQSLMQQASGGKTTSARNSAWSQLQSMGMDRSTLNKMTNLSDQSTATQNGESGGFNQALSQSVQYINDFTTALSNFLSATGLGGASGAAQGYAAGGSLGGSMFGSSLPGAVMNGMGMGVGMRVAGGLLSRLGGGSAASGAGNAGSVAQMISDWGGAATVASDLAPLVAVIAASDVVKRALGGSGTYQRNVTSLQKSQATQDNLPLTGPMARGLNGIMDPLYGGAETAWDKFYRSVGGFVNWARTSTGNSKVNGYASGGVVPGYTPGVDGHTVRVSGGEGILTPEATMGVGGAATINALNRKYAGYRGGGGAGRPGHFDVGGITGGDDSLGLATDADSMLFAGGGGVGGLGGTSGTSSSGNGGGSISGSGGGGYGPAVSASAGGGTQNGRTIYNYLLRNLFGGNKIAAAGAIASIWGESSWNPEASEGSYPGAGKGLIQWTGSNLSKAMGWTPLTGNASKDMSAQLPGIIAYVHGHGSMGTISQMLRAKTVSAAAQLWDSGVEGAGIDDVHPAGITGAGQIAGLSRSQVGLAGGGTFIAGERGPEAVTISNGQSANVMTAGQTASLLRGTSAMAGQGPWTTSATAMYALDALSPANSVHSAGSSGVTVHLGGITIQGGGMSGSQFSGTGTGSDINVMEQQLEQAVQRAITKSGMLDAIRQGNTG